MIAIVDYGMGNLLSVKNALDYLGEDSDICDHPDSILKAEKIILPGVGSFPDCMKNLKEKGFTDVLNHKVLEQKIPILGICLGMQVMAGAGFEMGSTEGLGWFDAEVIKMKPKDSKLKIPNIGWETVSYLTDNPLLRTFRKNPDFYFVHSYFMNCFNEDDVTSWYNLDDQKITASVQKENIFGTQFHPEKSSDIGREVLNNFIEY